MEENNKEQPLDSPEVALGYEADVEMQHAADKLFVVRAGLLGDFNEQGEYTVDYNVLTELLGIKKIILSTTEAGYAATAKVGEYKIKFIVEIFEETNFFLRADLFLLEDSGGVSMEHREVKTFIASYSNVNNAFFRESVKKEFNLITEIEALGKDINDDEIAKLILEIKNKHKRSATFIDMLMEVQSEIYVIRMLEVLGRAGNVGEKIVREYKEEAEKQGKTTAIGQKNVYTKLKEILDAKIKKNGGFEAIGVQKDKNQILKDARKVVDEYYGTFHEMIVRVPKTEVVLDKNKDASKAATLSKPAGKPGGGKNKGDKDKKKKKADDKGGEKKKEKKPEKKSTLSSYGRIGSVVAAERTVRGLPAAASKPVVKIEPPKTPKKTEPKKVVDKKSALTSEDLYGEDLASLGSLSETERRGELSRVAQNTNSGIVELPIEERDEPRQGGVPLGKGDKGSIVVPETSEEVVPLLGKGKVDPLRRVSRNKNQERELY